MTRFARAKGSKSSNQRVPEESTPWHEMKQELVRKQTEAKENEKRKEMNVIRQKNYDNFLKEISTKPAPHQWATFPQEDKPKAKKLKPPAKQKQNKDDNMGSDNNSESLDRSVVKNKKKKVNSSGWVEEVTLKEDSPDSVPVKGKRKHTIAINDNVVKKKQKFSDNTDSEANSQKYTHKKLEQKEITKDDVTGVAKKYGINLKTNKKPKTQEENGTPDGNIKNKQRKFEKKPKKIRPDKRPNRKSKNHDSKLRKNGSEDVRKVIMDGNETVVVNFKGFPVTKEDKDRLISLEKEMKAKGIPQSEINSAMKLERRRAEKALSRAIKKICFNCREQGHVIADCPKGKESVASGTCYKCGSTEHSHFDCKVVKGDNFKFATCFICKEQGHISRQCPDNPKGLYPKGGACKLCGDVTHLKKNCPKYVQKQENDTFTLDTLSNNNIESLDVTEIKTKPSVIKNKVVKF